MKYRYLAWQAALLLSAQPVLAADVLPSNPETDSALQSLGITVGSGLSRYGQRDGYYLVFEKDGSGWRLASIENRARQIDKLSNKEILFVSRDIREVEPDYRDGEISPKTTQFTCRSGMINQEKSGKRNYNPCDSSLTPTIDYKVGTQALLTVATLGLNVLTGTGVRDVAVDKTKVLALLQETKALDRVREEKAADDRRTYLDAFAKAKSTSALNAFIQRYSDNDPDGLVPQAIERRDLAKGNEYRRAFDNATTVAALDSFMQRYQGNDPDNLISKAMERRKVALAEEQKNKQREEAQAAYSQLVEAGKQKQRLAAVRTIGTKICNSSTGTRNQYMGLVNPEGPVTRPVTGMIVITGFTEGHSGEKLQIRTASITHTDQYGKVTNGDYYDLRGIRVMPGNVFWDEAVNWRPCD